jgi:hypothetical protein
MTNRKTETNNTNTAGNTVKDPEDWTTGGEPMTGAQRSYLQTLCEEAHEPMDETLTKAQASERIEALQQRTGRGTRHRASRPAAGDRTGGRGAGTSAEGVEPHARDGEGRVDD